MCDIRWAEWVKDESKVEVLRPGCELQSHPDNTLWDLGKCVEDCNSEFFKENIGNADMR